ncbi:MAG TPA: CHAT domain-containing protein [Allosphingosinicella sp.]
MAAAEGVRKGLSNAQSLDAVTAQQKAIVAALATGSAPFYDLTVCSETDPEILWSPARSGRQGFVTLDHLADDREIEIYRSSTGRLRSRFSDLSAAGAFALDVRILALRHALRGQGGADPGAIWLQLGEAFASRRIGADAFNQEQAIAAFISVLSARDQAHVGWGLAQGRLCFAYLTRLVGDRADNLERAIAACQAALPVLERNGETDAWANSQLVLAGVWHDRMRGDRAANIERAIAADRAALGVLTRSSDPGRWAAAQNNLAVHLSSRRLGDRQENVEAAIAAYQAAAEVINRDGAPQAWPGLQSNLAQVYAEREKGGLSANQERAIAMLGEALAAMAESNFSHSSAHYNMGEIYRRRLAGDRQANLETAVRFYRLSLLGDSPGERSPIIVGAALGSVLIELGRYEEAGDALLIASRAAERLIGLGLNEAQTRDVLSDARQVYTLLAYATVKMGDPARALSLLSAGKSRLLSASLAADTIGLSPAEAAELRRLRGEIHRQEFLLETEARGEPAETPSRHPGIDSLESLRRQAVSLYEKGMLAIVAQPALADVVADDALVAPIVTDHGTAILVAAPGGHVTAYDAPEVLRAGLNAILTGSGRPGGWLGAAKGRVEFAAALAEFEPAFRRSLGGAIGRALVAAGVRPGQAVAILPDGASALAPLGLVRDERTGRTLIEDYQISFTPSLSALAASRRRIASGGSATLGLVRSPAEAATGLDQLDFAPIEGALVAANFGPARSQAWNGVEKAPLLEALGSLTYWHFATHGLFNWAHPSRSGVLIGGGRATWLRLSDLLESRQSLGAPRLVVLSACNSGLSDVDTNPDEFTGLPTGFLFAGAAGVVASLWPVNDLSTSLLMSRFYDLHSGDGQPPARALREAQTWLRNASLSDLQAYVEAKRVKGALTEPQAVDMGEALVLLGEDSSGPQPFADPFYWGAFVLYGG